MNKIKYIIFAVCSVVFSFTAQAQAEKQHRNFDKENFIARRNAYITAEVGLTPEEAADFIPLCNKFQQEMFDIGRQARRLSREVRQNKNATDADYNKVIDECVDVNLKQAQLEKEYYNKFKKILSPQKLYKYLNAEKKFAREFMKGGDDKRQRK